MAADTAVGYILETGASSADKTQFQQLVTIDAPRRGNVIHSCLGRQGVYFLTEELAFGRYHYYVHVLPTLGGLTDTKYESAPKQEYIWRSKKYIMPGRTTWGACKVVHSKGCVKLRLYLDGCCRYETVVQGCAPFRLPAQLAGVAAEIELIGTARVTELHLASTMQELTNNE